MKRKKVELDIEEHLQDEEILVHDLVDNKDGSITIEVLINIYLKQGFYSTNRKIRLKKVTK